MPLNRSGRFSALLICLAWAVSACHSTGASAPPPAAPVAGSGGTTAEAAEAERARRAAQVRLMRCQQQPEICVQSSNAGGADQGDVAH